MASRKIWVKKADKMALNPNFGEDLKGFEYERVLGKGGPRKLGRNPFPKKRSKTERKYLGGTRAPWGGKALGAFKPQGALPKIFFGGGRERI